MLTSTTLIGLACLIANSSPQDQAQLTGNLEKGEVIRIEQIINSGACLPENFEASILKGIETQNINGIGSLPSRDCMM